MSTEKQDNAPRLLYDRKGAAANFPSVSGLWIANKRLSTRRIGKKVLVPHGELVRFSRQDHPESVTAKAA